MRRICRAWRAWRSSPTGDLEMVAWGIAIAGAIALVLIVGAAVFIVWMLAMAAVQ